MRISAGLLLGLALGIAVPGIAAAAERKSCLTPDERRAAIAARKAVPLAHAMHVVKAKLARRGGQGAPVPPAAGPRLRADSARAQDGKVTQARVDAADGHWLDGS